MNKELWKNKTVNFCKKINGKTKDIALLCVLGFALIWVGWLVFHADDTQNVSNVQPTATEVRVMQLLQEIDGVGDANVMIYETEEGIQSVAVVCEGGNDFRVIMNVRGAVAAALGTNEKIIKVYLKKE